MTVHTHYKVIAHLFSGKKFQSDIVISKFEIAARNFKYSRVNVVSKATKP